MTDLQKRRLDPHFRRSRFLIMKWRHKTSFFS